MSCGSCLDIAERDFQSRDRLSSRACVGERSPGTAWCSFSSVFRRSNTNVTRLQWEVEERRVDCCVQHARPSVSDFLIDVLGDCCRDKIHSQRMLDGSSHIMITRRLRFHPLVVSFHQYVCQRVEAICSFLCRSAIRPKIQCLFLLGEPRQLGVG